MIKSINAFTAVSSRVAGSFAAALPAFVALSILACANQTEVAAPVSLATFKLANGSSISDAAADDYNPIILQLSNGTLALAFASTRSCSGCLGHNVFVASSVGIYGNDGKVPAFNAPQVITANATPLNYSTRLRLTAETTSNNINVFVRDTVGPTMYTGSISPVSAVPINVGASLLTIINGSCASGTPLGMDSSGLIISTAGPSGPVSRYNYVMSVPSCPTNTIANSALASAIHVSSLRSSSIGIPEGFLVTDNSGYLTAQTPSVKGPVLQVFMKTMTTHSLFLTGATVFQASQAAGDLIVFSAAAASGQQSDMYVITDRTPAALWLKYTAFGAQPVP